MTILRVTRREFVGALGCAAAWPVMLHAQQTVRVPCIGVLMTYAENDTEGKARVRAFGEEFQKLGWTGGRNARVEYRFAAGSPDRFDALAKELLALQPDVIVASSVPALAAVQAMTDTVPIVFVTVSDPIGSGFITSLARPGGNITGVLLFEASISGKWMTMLKEIAPHLTRAALMANPKTSAYEYFLRAAQALAPSLDIELLHSPVENGADIEHVIASFASVPNGGLVLPPDSTTTLHRNLIIGLASRHRMPTVYAGRQFVVAGGLMSYDTDRLEQYRQVASYVDRILRGAKPADLPVQAPTKYETVST
jgi:putative ABC transport system substrate-binding protein